jgi:hypothetical protein
MPRSLALKKRSPAKVAGLRAWNAFELEDNPENLRMTLLADPSDGRASDSGS